MTFQLIKLINPGHCPQCGGQAQRMWVVIISDTRYKIVCCEKCL